MIEIMSDHFQAIENYISISRECFHKMSFIKDLDHSTILGISAKDYSIVLNCYYLLEDTQLAKANYHRFGLSGPTKYEDDGELYLRLYGVLNAIWLQKEAAIKIFEKLIQNPDRLKKTIKTISAMDAIELRKIAASHTTNHRMSESKISYIISRMDLRTGKVMAFSDVNQSIGFDLKKSLEDFDRYLSELLHEFSNVILDKIMKITGAREDFSKFKEYVRYSKEAGDGKMIFDMKNPEIIIDIV